MYKSMTEYFDNLFILGGGGQVYGYEPDTYLVVYAVDKFDYETLHAIERKMEELGMKKNMDISLHPDIKRMAIRLFIERRSN